MTVRSPAVAGLFYPRDPHGLRAEIGPAHHVWLRGIATSTADAFETLLGRVSVDRHAQAAIADLTFVHGNDAAHAPDVVGHGAWQIGGMVQTAPMSFDA